ncbi:MAG: J domain-containing protein [Alphaproteobacteria bacterium]
MRDPYSVLGVGKTASEDDIKKAFRKQAKVLHPDRNKTDPKAKDKFAELNSAYEILGDDKKRKQFDAGEIDAEGKPRAGFGAGFGGGPFGGARSGRAGGFSGGPFGGGGFGGPGFDASDLFADFFRSGAGDPREKKRGPEPGPDIKVVAKITLAESLSGTTTRVSLPTGRMIEVKVPAGVTEGKVIRLKRQGHASPAGGPPGDAYVTIHIAQDHRFQVDGKNLKVRVQIPLEDAVLGGRVRVPTLEGAVDLSIPPYSSSGQTLRLRGKGVPAEDGAGDLLATIEVTIPKEPDLELEMMMKRWRDRKPR